ncbi:alpha/beta fold hydrolase [Pseudonocardia oroxyli]|uniref:Pimeloyl-ACP methyl ester carboxylesterase n=1 Tax=Pseudonocardia oroxyli TaxID=366584 RepID=A0A1G7TX62_PSEOR|nr:alpha/beta hydrolase [Pseudonocardia oroxyli]SDG39110.1 Pimeloyl-ACP methyl ester carboxylesterase [Pseudonocardia oroxyli]
MTTVVADLNGISLAYDVRGEGRLVVLVMGTGSPGRVWHLHQVPALLAAGHRVATFDNRGIPPTTECADGFTVDDMVGDTAALIEHLGGGPAHVIGTSLGARIVQELALARPDLVSRAVAMGAHARLDPVAEAQARGEIDLHDDGVVLPPAYHAAVKVVQNLSPVSRRAESVQDWLDVYEMGGSAIGPGERAQLAASVDMGDRRPEYRAITVPFLVVGFADDTTIPPHLSREVAEAIPAARYVEVPDTGHVGYLERPATVNEILLDFLNEERT